MSETDFKREFMLAFIKYATRYMNPDDKWHTYSFVFKLNQLPDGNVELLQMDECLTGSRFPQEVS